MRNRKLQHETENSGHRANAIKQVAAAANVSAATVSRTLRRPDVVARITRERVHEAVQAARIYAKYSGLEPTHCSHRPRCCDGTVICKSLFSDVIRGIEHVACE